MSGISIVSDTNPLIYLLDGNAEVAEYLDEKQVWISVISELSPQIKRVVKELLQKYPIKLPDAIIAATSIYLDLPLLTADTGFRNIPELKLILLEL